MDFLQIVTDLLQITQEASQLILKLTQEHFFLLEKQLMMLGMNKEFSTILSFLFFFSSITIILTDILEGVIKPFKSAYYFILKSISSNFKIDKKSIKED